MRTTRTETEIWQHACLEGKPRRVFKCTWADSAEDGNGAGLGVDDDKLDWRVGKEWDDQVVDGPAKSVEAVLVLIDPTTTACFSSAAMEIKVPLCSLFSVRVHRICVCVTCRERSHRR